jgi:adenine-specific DNA-methyltransferase
MTKKLDMTTPDGVSQNIERIAALFPHCVTEMADGKQIDFDLLRQELSRDIVEGPKERYRLEWPGKREAIVTANMPTTNTLRPVREDSVNFDTTENLYIEGNNLEVLKLLQESYLGKVKMIYIDPPYNTGNDFVYRDNFAQDTESFKTDSGMTDELGNRLVANPETAGRYHSDWLTMMYPRLKLARNLLTDDGVIFISIDDNEVHNLRKMCDEVFGEVNFVANIVWKHTQQSKNDERYFSRQFNYTVNYAKNLNSLPNFRFQRSETDNKNYSNPDNDSKGDWRSGDVRSPNYRKTLCFDVIAPNGNIIKAPDNGWRWSEESMMEKIKTGEIIFRKDGNSIVRKIYLFEQDGRTPENIWTGDEFGTTRQANTEIKDLFEDVVFDTPKPTQLIKKMMSLFYQQKDLFILDFFSGSATTAHAVMQLNAEDGGNRKFIMVQLPEKTDEKSEAYKAGYTNICEIGKERIRRAGAKIVEMMHASSQKAQEKGTLLFDNAETGHAPSVPDIGFRVYRLDTSNMQDVYYRPQDYKQEMMTELFANHIKPDRTADDLMAQIMLDWGLPLSLPIEQTNIAGKTVYKVDGNTLYCCFDEGIDEAFVKAMVKKSSETITKNLPLRIVFHDYAFANDTAKENVRQLLKQLSPDTEMRVV